MSKIQTTTLDNGLRVVTDAVPDMHSVALGIWAGVGTRDENLKHNGVAHMVEHMLFKGTKKRSAQTIAEVIENVGGNLNAYTSREITSYHGHLLKNDVPLALDVLADMYQNYTMPADEIERERHVILQEIGMTNDTPDDLIFDNYYETAYPGQGIGAPILGREKHITGMTREALQEHITRFYTPGRTVISAAGSLKHDDFVDQVAGLFNDLPADQKQEKQSVHYAGGEHRAEKDLEQCHFILGFRGLSRLDDGYYFALMLSMALGGGMSSRLFQEVREKRGLVYSIFSFHSSYIDDGQFGIYAGTGPDKISEMIPVICDEVSKISETLTESELERGKAQLKAGILMGRESMMARADQQGKFMLYKDKQFDLEATIRRIDEVDLAGVKKIARKIFAGKPTIAALGPLGKLEDYASICKRLKV